MKKFLTFVLAFALLIGCSFQDAYAEVSEPPEIEATTAIIIDAHSGEVIWEKNSEVQMAPASMTKMMTAILVIENLSMDTVVTVDKDTVNTGGNVIYMKNGEKFTVEQLLKAMLVTSANDCAVALAKEISGSVEKFAALMNQKAGQLGCRNTSFVNPNGLDSAKHLSTAYDIAMIAKEFMKYDVLREIVSMDTYTLPKTNKHEYRVLYSTNRLLFDKTSEVKVNGNAEHPYYKYAIGVKTGYTDKAQGCLASAAYKNGTEIIAVVMHSSDLGRFGDSKALLEYALDNYRTEDLLKPGDAVGEIRIKGAAGGKTQCEAQYFASCSLAVGESADNYTTKVEWVDNVIAPVKAGTVVGTVGVYDGDKLISETPVVTSEDAEEGVFSFIYNGHVAYPGKLALIIIAAVIVLFFILIIVLRIANRRKRKKRRQERIRQLAEERSRNNGRY